jgi:ATP-dependent DNA helicase DinG
MATSLIQIEEKHPEVKNLVWLNSPILLDHFPFPGIRAAQEQILQAAERLVAENKKFLIVEAPTGVGKSGIAMALASWAKTLPLKNPLTQSGAYILSPQKTLTKQYMNDFEDNGLVELKGKSNYYCATHDTDCDSAAIINNSSKEGDNRSCCEQCPYKDAKKKFIDNPLGVTNFAFYLNETQYAGQLKNRKMLILDEGHNTESQILGFADTVIKRHRTEEIGLGRVPTFKPGENMKCKQWLQTTFVPTAQQFMTDLTNQIAEAKLNDAPREALMKLVKKLDSWDKFICRLNRFLNSDDLTNWLCFTTEPNRGEEAELYIKPLTATMFADEILFNKAEIVVIMSATILDFGFFMRNLGINPQDAITLAVDCDFPIANRPVFVRPQGSMAASIDKESISEDYPRGRRKRDITMPKMLAFVEKIMDKYEGRKGIIHTHSYEFTKQIIAHLQDTKHAGRIVTHSGDVGSRDAAVVEHMTREDDTVLISPSMTEGLDLREDLGRFCVIIKVPYPYIDPYVDARMKRDSDWYAYCTLLTIVQSTGRVVRSKTDKAHCYILDSDFETLIRRAGRMLPRWWSSALMYKGVQ